MKICEKGRYHLCVDCPILSETADYCEHVIEVYEGYDDSNVCSQVVDPGAVTICPNCQHYSVCRFIANQPCAECSVFAPQQKHGEWNRFYRSGTTVSEGYVSSCCDMWNERKSSYCPNCGAVMECEV